MSKQHCRSNRQLCCLLLRQCCRFGQQCRINVRLCRKDEISAQNSFDIVAVFGNKVERCFDIVAGVDRALVDWRVRPSTFSLLHNEYGQVVNTCAPPSPSIIIKFCHLPKGQWCSEASKVNVGRTYDSPPGLPPRTVAWTASTPQIGFHF